MERKYTIKQAADALDLSHWRVRQVYKQMGIVPIGYYHGSPLFNSVQVGLMRKRNKKSGPQRTNSKRK